MFTNKKGFIKDCVHQETENAKVKILSQSTNELNQTILETDLPHPEDTNLSLWVNVTQFVETVHISEIKSGDTIIHNNQMTTVCGNNIKHSEFMGITLFGDSYRSGYRLVERIYFK